MQGTQTYTKRRKAKSPPIVGRQKSSKRARRKQIENQTGVEGITFEMLETRQMMSATGTSSLITDAASGAATTVSLAAATSTSANNAQPAGAIVVSAGGSIQNAINSASAGDTIYVKNGTYNGTLDVNVSNLTIVAQTDGQVIINGGLVGGGVNLKVKGLTFQGVQNQIQNEFAAVRTNDGWYLENIIVQNNTGTGIGVFGTNVTLINPISRFNGTNGLGGANAVNVLVKGGEIYGNNRGISSAPWAGAPDTVNIGGKWFLNAGWEGGGGKWYQTDGLHVDGTKYHDNGGPGLWLDGYNKNYVIENVESYDNTYTTAAWQGQGIAIEINYNGVLKNNYTHGNSGSGIGIMESTGVTLTGNTFIDSALEFRAMDGRPVGLSNVTVTGNYFKNSGMGFSIGNAAGRNIVISGNTFATDSDRNYAAALSGNPGAIGTVNVPDLGGSGTPVVDPPQTGGQQPGGGTGGGDTTGGSTGGDTTGGSTGGDNTGGDTGGDTPTPTRTTKLAQKPTGDGFKFLSDMDFAGTPTSGWGPVELDQSNGERDASDGHYITIGGYNYKKGLGFHADAEITYNLGGRYTKFVTDIGIDDESKNDGAEVRIELWGDGKMLEHINVAAGGVTRAFGADVTGVREFTIKAFAVGANGDYGAHVSMGYARVLTTGATPPSTGSSGGNSGGGSTGGGVGSGNGSNAGSGKFDGSWIGPDNNTTDDIDYVVDLGESKWSSATNGYGPIERNRSVGGSDAKDGNVMSIGGQKFAKGLGVHANSEITYDLKGQFDWFNAWVGVDDEVGAGKGDVTFQVWADGKKLYDSGEMTAGDKPKWIDVGIQGKKQLKLVVLSNGGIANDHADWANGQIIREGAAHVSAPGSGSNSGGSSGSDNGGGSTDAAGRTYLSDLDFESSKSGYGPVERDSSNGEEDANDGVTMTIDGVKYRKGLGVHSDSRIVVDLDGKYSLFRADVGIDDEVGDNGSADFQVWADGKLVWDSKTLTGADEAKKCYVDVQGVKQLWLVVTHADSGTRADHADWGGAYVTKAA